MKFFNATHRLIHTGRSGQTRSIDIMLTTQSGRQIAYTQSEWQSGTEPSWGRAGYEWIYRGHRMNHQLEVLDLRTAQIHGFIEEALAC